MTTITYRDGIMAGDRRISDTGRGLIEGGTTKIFRREDDGALIGVAGSLGVAQRFARWFLAGEQGEMPPLRDKDANTTAEAIVVRPNGKVENIYELGAIYIESDYYAIGSGSIAALAAMDMGADARRAVEIACGRDAGTGNGIDELHLNRAVIAVLQPAQPPAPTTVSDSGEGESAKLWQLHEVSSDEVCAVPSKEIGEAVAAWGNARFAPKDENDPCINFVVEPWSGDAESHANDLAASWQSLYAYNGRGEPIDWLNNPPRALPEGDAQPAVELSAPILQDKDKDEEAGEVWKRGPEVERLADRIEEAGKNGLVDFKVDLEPVRRGDATLEEIARDTNAMMDAVERGESQPQQPATPIPEGFTKWEGATAQATNPDIDPATGVEILHRDGRRDMGLAGDYEWEWSDVLRAKVPEFAADFEDADDIIAYRVIDGSGDKPLIVDDTPTIPRSEIPQGAAVETFTDAGVETVKLSGITHIVDDAPERVAETQPDAAYAPIHNVDDPATPEQLEAAGIIEPGASELAAMRTAKSKPSFIERVLGIPPTPKQTAEEGV